MNQFKLTGNSSYIRAFSYDQIKLLSSEILLNKGLIFFHVYLFVFQLLLIQQYLMFTQKHSIMV